MKIIFVIVFLAFAAFVNAQPPNAADMVICTTRHTQAFCDSVMKQSAYTFVGITPVSCIVSAYHNYWPSAIVDTAIATNDEVSFFYSPDGEYSCHYQTNIYAHWVAFISDFTGEPFKENLLFNREYKFSSTKFPGYILTVKTHGSGCMEDINTITMTLSKE